MIDVSDFLFESFTGQEHFTCKQIAKAFHVTVISLLIYIHHKMTKLVKSGETSALSAGEIFIQHYDRNVIGSSTQAIEISAGFKFDNDNSMILEKFNYVDYVILTKPPTFAQITHCLKYIIFIFYRKPKHLIIMLQT